MRLTVCFQNETTAAVVLSSLRISNNGDLWEIEGLCGKVTPVDIEEGIKGQIQLIEKRVTVCHDFL